MIISNVKIIKNTILTFSRMEVCYVLTGYLSRARTTVLSIIEIAIKSSKEELS
jgi:hypothetical protein